MLSVLIFGTAPLKPLKDLPTLPWAHRALTQLSFTHSRDSRHAHAGAKLLVSRFQVLLPLVQQHTGATQQCLTSWGMTDYTTSLSLLEFAVLSLNIKENLLQGTKQAVLLCNAVQQSDILAQMYTIYNPKEKECTIVQPNTFSWKQHLYVIFLGLYQLRCLH